MPASTPRKRPASRKRPVAGSPGVLRLDREENVTYFAEREPLFSIGDVEYTIPKHVPASWAIQATDIAINKGEAVAMNWALLKMLGEDGFRALQQCDTLTEEDLGTITLAVTRRIMPVAGDDLPKDS